jgi:quercetin dioxygenase-like cupin family protein
MQKLSLDALAREHLHLAEQSSAGRSAHTVVGGHEHIMRQTMVALTAGTTLAEHENPGEATVLVLSGRVRLETGQDSWEGRRGDLIIVPAARHSLHAVEDAVILLSVAKRGQDSP